MMDLVSLGLALSVGQVGAGEPTIPPAANPPRVIVAPQIGQPLPPVVQPLPQMVVPAPQFQAIPQPGFVQEVTPQDPQPGKGGDSGPPGSEPKTNGTNGNGENGEGEKEAPEPYWFMRNLQGTGVGSWMEDRRISVSGWTQGSYTYGLNNPFGNNGTVVWNDRANQFLLQQHWIRLEKAIDTESKCPSWGWRVDTLFGSDYRYTLPRGLWNDQLKNSKRDQNGVFAQSLYGVDIPQAYISYYDPNMFEGTEFRVGRMFCQWGYESIEAISSPLLSKSYAFNWGPPFTHWGVMAVPKLSKNVTAKLMAANGNDVMIGDPSEEWRFMGAIGWTSDDSNDTLTLGTSFGRGKFNAGDPFCPATVSLMSECAGRNNINVFDLVYTHKVNDCLNYGLELLYGYQYGVPTTAVVGFIPGAMIDDSRTHGTAKWSSVVNYFTYTHSEKATSILRLEWFQDYEGQRTGFEGAYYAATYGIQFKPTNALQIRPEIRYDYAGESQPFDGGTRHGLLTAAADFIYRW